MDLSVTSTTFNYDSLLLSDHPRVTRAVTLISGQNLSRGAVLGRITAGGKYTLSTGGATSDGSEVPRAILAADAHADGADLEVVVYETGHFNEDRITIGADHTLASIRDGLREKGIHLSAAVSR